jgi:uncharacterized membrane protein SpoIIM required for sporulation
VELNVSLAVFVLSLAIGWLSSAHDPDFARVILGDEYIAMTEANIAAGDPMAVYKSRDEIGMFLGITFNNLLVAFRAFALGAFFAVGTVVILLYNGIMVGTFQHFFMERALFQESFLTIWMHGALEISAIVIAGGAGITLGRGLLYPGNLPRVQSFQLSARRAFTIMVGLVPVFVAAAFIEGFFTRITELPDMLRGLFIFTCFGFVGLYFWWYPRVLFRGEGRPLYNPDELMPHMDTDLDPKALRKNSEVFSSAFVMWRKLALPATLGAALLALLYTAAFGLIQGREGLELVSFRKFSLYNLYQFHSYDTFFWNFFLNTFLLATVVYAVLRLFSRMYATCMHPNAAFGAGLFLKCLVVATVFELFILSGNGLVASLGILVIPFLLFWVVVAALEGKGLPDAFSRMLQLLGGTHRHIFLTFFFMALLSLALLFLIDSPFAWLYFDVLQWNIEADADTKFSIAMLSLVFLNTFGLCMVVPLLLFGQLLEYFSAVEAREAPALAERVLLIGTKKSAYGLERE